VILVGQTFRGTGKQGGDVGDGEHVDNQDPADSGATADSAAPVDAGAPAPGASPDKPRKHPKRRRRWIIAGSVVGGVIVILVIAAFITAHFTSRSSFCNSCHEMNLYYSSWQSSTHASAECRDCHIPPGTVPYIETKLGSFREIYVHLSGNPEPPIAVTREIPNASCYRCHSNPPSDPTLPTVTFKHEKHSGINCISCHVRLVHRTINPPVYQDPAAMASCFACHNGSIAPNTCSTCHTPPHEVRGECSTCHDTAGWSSAAGKHTFALTGAHANLACTDCHVSKAGVANIPGTQLAQADPTCVICHDDHHKGLTDCAGCHTPTTWRDVDFEHPFTLTGAHAALTCADCHVSKPGAATVAGTQFPAADSSCTSCHGDQHKGLTDCAQCHTPQGWKPANFTHPVINDHHGQATGIDCVKCHPSGYGSHYCSCHGGNPPSD
jgi:nitrate/TMAO reductase-like tetraheme cytochrome c subunit